MLWGRQPAVFGTANHPTVLGINLNTGMAGFVIRDRMQSQSVRLIVHHWLRNQDIGVVVDRPLNVVVLVQDQARGMVVGVFGVGHVGPVHDDDPIARGDQLAAAPFNPMVREPGAPRKT